MVGYTPKGAKTATPLADMMRLQADELSLPARQLVPLLEGLAAASARAEDARSRLLEWDHVLRRGSVAGGIYVAWEGALRSAVSDRLVPEGAGLTLGLSRVVETLHLPPGEWGPDPVAACDALLLEAPEAAESEPAERHGADAPSLRRGTSFERGRRAWYLFGSSFQVHPVGRYRPGVFWPMFRIPRKGPPKGETTDRPRSDKDISCVLSMHSPWHSSSGCSVRPRWWRRSPRRTTTLGFSPLRLWTWPWPVTSRR